MHRDIIGKRFAERERYGECEKCANGIRLLEILVLAVASMISGCWAQELSFITFTDDSGGLFEELVNQNPSEKNIIASCFFGDCCQQINCLKYLLHIAISVINIEEYLKENLGLK